MYVSSFVSRCKSHAQSGFFHKKKLTNHLVPQSHIWYPFFTHEFQFRVASANMCRRACMKYQCADEKQNSLQTFARCF